MRRLADAHEHLDGGLSDARMLEGNLRDLARINRWFGGTRLSIDALRRLVARHGRAKRPLRILDVGTGAADIPVAMLRARGSWAAVHVTAIDSREEVLAAAHAVDPALASTAGLQLVVGDGRSLPYPDGAFDVAHASLVLHHLAPDEAASFLRELRRVSTVGVVVNDLGRGWLAWIGAWALLHLMTRNRFTLHDGPVSVRRAYTPAEARAMLAEAQLRPVVELRGFAGHRWAIAAVTASSADPE